MDQLRDTISSVKSTVTDLFEGNSSSSDLPDIERSIINPSVTVGSLYDARNDSVGGVLYGHINTKKVKINDKVLPIMYTGENIPIENLLQILQIDDETRLDTILKINKPNGILSVVNYSYLIDAYTRLIYYLEPMKEESLIYDYEKHKYLPLSSTHLITKTKSGISLIIILQLSRQNSSINKIDNSLEYLTSNLGSDLDIEQIISNEQQFLKNIVTTKVYSNLIDLSRLNNICEVYRQLQKLRHDPRQYRPLNLTLSPINRFFPHSDLTKNIYIPISTEYTKHIKTFLLPLSFNVNVFKRDLKHLKSSLLKDYLPQELDRADQLFTAFEDFYSTQLEKCRDTVIQIRSEEMPQETLVQLLDVKEQKFLRKKRDGIKKYFDDLKSKNSLIINLQKERIDYLNVSNTDINEDDDQETLRNKLIKKNRNISIFCSNDELKRNHNPQWDELIEELIKFRTHQKNVRLVYADFSYSSYKLEELTILYSKNEEKKKKITGPPKTQPTINIVLFGESGVGKSTFINAFANYLFFDNIDQARSQEPIVVIPVSFIMQINDQFDERLIQFGHAHTNENHNNLGQTVTQKCKSYEFSTHDDKILKIIDTPGFGDTRGQDQDDANLKEIFSYIQNLTHINALCILLKPNVKELNPSFKSSFREMFHFFGQQFYKNIFFCFTNSQSTFFTLGDTCPALNKFLKEFRQIQMDLKKENTFCFDSNSLRYLVALENATEFEEKSVNKFKQSWVKSVKESNRLVSHICSQETHKCINGKWISIEQIKGEINDLIRPMLEGLRNISRNIILSDNEAFKRSIQLIPIALHSPKLICYRSGRPCETFGELYVMSDYLHELSDPCENEHLSTNYKLNYRFIKERTDYSPADANDYLYGIIKACANFDYFLNENGQANKDGPFLSGMKRMMNEEKAICEQEQAHRLNKKLYYRLEKSLEQYNNDLEKINSTDDCSYLQNICSRIEGIKQMPIIYEQLNPIQ